MADENEERARQAVDAFNRRDLDSLLSLIAPDVECIPLQAEMEGGAAYTGHDGVRRWWENLLGVFPDFHSVIDDVRTVGDMTVTRLQLSGQGKGSDAPMLQTNWQATRWRDGTGRLVAHVSDRGRRLRGRRAAGVAKALGPAGAPRSATRTCWSAGAERLVGADEARSPASAPTRLGPIGLLPDLLGVRNRLLLHAGMAAPADRLQVVGTRPRPP